MITKEGEKGPKTSMLRDHGSTTCVSDILRDAG
jgi:hypothetical protein